MNAFTHKKQNFNLPSVSPQVWYVVFAASLLSHLLLGTFVGQSLDPTLSKPGPVRITVRTPEATPPPLPPEPKPKEKPKKPEKKLPAPNETVPKTVTDATPIQGLTKDSVSDKGTMSAPVGNTLMVEDTGKRVNPNDVKPLGGDLSSPAILQRDTIIVPPYTDQALDASLEGSWIVDVYVDVQGNVTEADLRKKIGYGMDEKVVASAKQAKFIPRKNKFGAAEAGWAEIKFTLLIP
ncbi:MAG: energy transducer TonB [Proteobacteria bacterium]|nr:energy transducer TonB [Pseudomonadota bacterium]